MQIDYTFNLPSIAKDSGLNLVSKWGLWVRVWKRGCPGP